MSDNAATSTDPRISGAALIRAATFGTIVFVVCSFVAVAIEEVRTFSVLVDLVLFFVGIGSFFVAYFRAVGRSRTHVLGVGGIYFLAGSTPRAVRIRLLGALVVQTVVAILTASLRPFTPLAFGMLVPMFGVGIAGLWGAFHGTYPERPERSASLSVDE